MLSLLKRLLLLSAALLLALPAAARTIVVGPGGQPSTFAAAVAEAEDGDTIAILPGTYRRDVATITQKKLTIRGIGERPVFEAAGADAEGKATWVVRNGDITIENIAFHGARAADRNGAGIRFERGRLVVRNCAFVDNQNGILTAGFEDAELSVFDSSFSDLPAQDGRNHLLYVGAIAKLHLQGSRFHRGALGHLVKSRARHNFIGYNLIQDGPAGNASYEIDLPNGGEAVLIGNVIAKGPRRDNPIAVSFGAEGPRWPRNRLVIAHNTFVNEGWSPTWFLRVHADRLATPPEVRALNNLLVGPGVLATGNPGRFDDNWAAARAMLVEADLLDYALPLDSWLRGRVGDPATAGPEFVPQLEFRLPVGTAPLLPPATWSPGAFQR